MIAFQSTYNKDSIRQPAVCGKFYPSSKKALQNQIESFEADNDIIDNIQALIVPHAGYEFSGSTAAKAYAHLNPGSEYEAIFILGICHYEYFYGVSVFNGDAYHTPLGDIPLHVRDIEKLLNSELIIHHPTAHQNEHSI